MSELIIMENENIKSSKFIFLEFAGKHKPCFRNMVVKLGEVLEVAEYYGNVDVYTSIFIYCKDVLNHLKEKRSISGYAGYLYSYYLFFDIDNKDLRKSLKVTQQLLNFFIKNWGVCKEDVAIAFSGTKGFHLALQTALFDVIQPANDLNVVFDRLRREIAPLAGFANEPSIDYSICKSNNLWRLLNTVNSKSGLYKIPLTASEIFSHDINQIKKLAEKPRPGVSTDETGLIPLGISEPNKEAVALYQEILNKIRKKSKLVKISNFRNIELPKSTNNALCKAIKRILRSNIRKGFRNQIVIRLASAARHARFDEMHTKRLLLQWNEKNKINLKESEITNPVKAAYRSSVAYHFHCNDTLLKIFCSYKKHEREECSNYRKFRTLSLLQQVDKDL